MNHELMQETVRQLERRIDWWRTTDADHYGLATPTMTALNEVASAMREAMNKTKDDEDDSIAPPLPAPTA